jgi:hypothetical protein
VKGNELVTIGAMDTLLVHPHEVFLGAAIAGTSTILMMHNQCCDKIVAMLCAKRKLTGEIVTAYLSSKAHGPFKCPDCGDEVILKTGKRTVNHFAHVNPLACQYADNESDEHRRCKMEIFQALQKEPHVRNVALEHRLYGRRA